MRTCASSAAALTAAARTHMLTSLAELLIKALCAFSAVPHSKPQAEQHKASVKWRASRATHGGKSIHTIRNTIHDDAGNTGTERAGMKLENGGGERGEFA